MSLGHKLSTVKHLLKTELKITPLMKPAFYSGVADIVDPFFQ